MAQLKSLLVTGASSFSGSLSITGKISVNSNIQLSSSSNLYLAGNTTYGLFNTGDGKLKDLVVDSLTTTVNGSSVNLGEYVANGKSIVATAISNKGQSTSSSDTWSTMATNIGNIKSDATNSVTSTGQVLSGYKYYIGSSNNLQTGTMPNNGNVSITLNTSTASYTIPSGYHGGTGKVSISLEEKTLGNSDNVNITTVTPSSGKVLSKVTVYKLRDYFYSTELEYHSIGKLYDKAGYTVTTTDYIYMTYGTTGYVDGTNLWLCRPASDFGDAATGDVLSGKTFTSTAGLKASGTMTNNGAVTTTLDTSTTSYTIPTGYHNGSGSVSITLEEKTLGDSATNRTTSVTPSSGKVLSKVTVYKFRDYFYSTALSYHSSNSATLYNKEGNSVTTGPFIHMTYGTTGYVDGTDLYLCRPASDFGDAATDDVLSGKTFTSTAGLKKSGTLKRVYMKYIWGGIYKVPYKYITVDKYCYGKIYTTASCVMQRSNNHPNIATLSVDVHMLKVAQNINSSGYNDDICVYNTQQPMTLGAGTYTFVSTLYQDANSYYPSDGSSYGVFLYLVKPTVSSLPSGTVITWTRGSISSCLAAIAGSGCTAKLLTNKSLKSGQFNTDYGNFTISSSEAGDYYILLYHTPTSSAEGYSFNLTGLSIGEIV